MSRDFSPRQHFMAHKAFPDLHFSNVIYKMEDGSEFPLYTEKDLEDRNAHKYIQILGADIYSELRARLSDSQFKALNSVLGKLAESDAAHGDVSGFPEPVLRWYFNIGKHYYHEPNDREFLEWALVQDDFNSGI